MSRWVIASLDAREPETARERVFTALSAHYREAFLLVCEKGARDHVMAARPGVALALGIAEVRRAAQRAAR